MILPEFHKITYSNDDVAHLCRIGGLHTDDLDGFREQLEDFAAVYRWEAAKYQDLPRSSDLKRELGAVRKRLTNLVQALGTLSEDARAELHLGFHDKARTDAARFATGTFGADGPSLLLPYKEPDQALIVGFSDVERILGGMDQALDSVLEHLPNRAPGQTRDFGLRLWIGNIKNFWERTTDAPFTRDATEAGEPITPAAIFCVEAFKMIEPDYPNSRILRELKDCIKRTKSTGRIVARNEQ